MAEVIQQEKLMFRLGLIINPVAGSRRVPSVLKGSDDGMVRRAALARGAVPKSRSWARQALLPLCRADHVIQSCWRWPEEMGGRPRPTAELGLPHRIVHRPAGRHRAERRDARAAARRMPARCRRWICCSSRRWRWRRP